MEFICNPKILPLFTHPKKPKSVSPGGIYMLMFTGPLIIITNREKTQGIHQNMDG